MSRRKKKWIVLLSLLLTLSLEIPVFASDYQNGDTLYQSYVYDHDKPVAIQTPYTYEKRSRGDELEGGFGELRDLHYSKETGKLYVADSKRNSIVVLDKDLNLEYELTVFEHQGVTDMFSGCSGVCVRDGLIYVADTNNSRIVTFRTDTYEFVRSFDKPVISQLGSGYSYLPTRLAVGITGQMYVIARGVNSGFIVLDSEGEFQSFVGAPDVKTDLVDEVWKYFMTKEQKAALLKSVPTEYESIMFDSKGFLYATTRSEGVQPIVRLNLQGIDILKWSDNKGPVGDSNYADISSAFVDVCVDENDVYYALDSYSGHIFAYNSAGKLLFAFGKNGSQSGMTNSPMAVELIDDRLLVADTVTGYINVYQCTAFGKAVLEADAAMNEGEYEKAEQCWKYVLEQCSTYTLAKESLGRLALYGKDYTLAMDYAKEAGDKEAYSDAFREYRSSFIAENYRILLGVIVAVAVAVFLYHRLIEDSEFMNKFRDSKLGKELVHAKYCSYHPFDGFWTLKREKRGSLLSANIIVVGFLIVYLMNVQFSGYLFINGQPEEVDALVSLLAAVIMMFCYCLGNWCFTSLMDGKGTMRDIYISMAVALRPYITGGLVLFAMSHVLTQQEMFLYQTVSAIMILWVLGLIFFGMMMTHDYMLGEGIKTMILTIIGMALIVFIALMIYNLISDMTGFFYSLYRELLYRQL